MRALRISGEHRKIDNGEEKGCAFGWNNKIRNATYGYEINHHHMFLILVWLL